MLFPLKVIGKKGIWIFGAHAADRIGKNILPGVMMELLYALVLCACHLNRLPFNKIYVVGELSTNNNWGEGQTATCTARMLIDCDWVCEIGGVCGDLCANRETKLID